MIAAPDNPEIQGAFWRNERPSLITAPQASAANRGRADNGQGPEPGYPRAPHHAAPDVAAEVVGAEEVGAARRPEAVGEVIGDRVVRGENGGEQRDGDHGREDPAAHEA